MDVRTEGRERDMKDLFPTWGRLLIVGTALATIAVAVLVNFQLGLITSVSVLIAVGVVTADSWNRELKEDTYASLTQLYSSYFAVLFLFIALAPSLISYAGFYVGLPLTLAIALSYIVTLNSIAFRSIDDYETLVETYEGPAVVYLPDGEYMDHVEDLAHQNKQSEE